MFCGTLQSALCTGSGWSDTFNVGSGQPGQGPDTGCRLVWWQHYGQARRTSTSTSGSRQQRETPVFVMRNKLSVSPFEYFDEGPGSKRGEPWKRV